MEYCCAQNDSVPFLKWNWENHYDVNLIFFSCSLDEWIKFDDDKVSIVTPEDILRLSGGGDWHIAYVLLYGPRRVEIMEEESEQ